MIDWTQVKAAVEVSEINEKAAEMLLFDAIGEIEGGGDSGGATINTPGAESAVIYGRTSGAYPKGYTDPADPRDADCRYHGKEDGKPDAVWLQVNVHPERRFKCVRVELLQEDESCNVYLIATNRAGAMVPATGFRLGSPYNNSEHPYKDEWKAPASPANIPMGHDSRFTPNDLGPYAGYIVDSGGAVISDIVGSMGLPNGQHMSYRIYMQER